MKEIKQGTLFGYDLVLKVTDEVETKIINENTLEKHIQSEKKRAVEDYKSELKSPQQIKSL